MGEVKRADVLIIGAGVLGVSLAYHLGRMGHKVLVLEREFSYAHHSSGKNAGMMRQLYRHPQLTEWTKRSIRTWPEEAKRLAFRQEGSLIVGRTVPEHHQELFEQREVEIFFEGKKQWVPAVYCATDGLLDPNDHIATLYRLTNKENVTYHFSTEVFSVSWDGDFWRIEAGTQGEIHFFEASWCVDAAGAWLNDFLSEKAPKPVEAQPYARHLFVIEGWESGYMPEKGIGFYWEELRHWYMRLWEERRRLLSICDQTPAEPDAFVPDPDLDERVAEQLFDALPEEAEKLTLGRSWFCFRTYTEDRLPVWGEDPRYPHFFWLAAFGGFGMSTSFAAAEDAARYISGLDVEVAEEFLPKRVQS